MNSVQQGVNSVQRLRLAQRKRVGILLRWSRSTGLVADYILTLQIL